MYIAYQSKLWETFHTRNTQYIYINAKIWNLERIHVTWGNFSNVKLHFITPHFQFIFSNCIGIVWNMKENFFFKYLNIFFLNLLPNVHHNLEITSPIIRSLKGATLFYIILVPNHITTMEFVFSNSFLNFDKMPECAYRRNQIKGEGGGAHFFLSF